MLNKIMLFLSDLVTVKATTNKKLKSILDFILLVILFIMGCIDWDKTLELWGL